MANIMTLKSIKNKASRNGFDLSRKLNFTAKCGELLPIVNLPVIPGDVYDIDLRSMVRTQPVNTAAFARMREYYDFYFVPYNLLWNKAGTFFTQMNDNPQHAVSADPTSNSTLSGELPYVTCQDIADYLYSIRPGNSTSYPADNYFGYDRSLCSAKLLEYLGYGNFYTYAGSDAKQFSTAPLMSNLELNLFGLLAYQKIYADYYRDSQWEKIVPATFNVDYIAGTDDLNFSDNVSLANFAKHYNFFDLRYCNWQKDLFHGVVPQAQYGDVAVAPLATGGTINIGLGGVPIKGMSKLTGTFPESTSGTANIQTGYINLSSTVSNTAGISILALRQYEFLQKWKEIAMSANKDYKSQIEKHWNVSVPDAMSEQCMYLGGITSNIDINEVVNTNITADNAADIAGKGVGVSNGKIHFENTFNTYGCIMCIYHCLPLLDYTTDYCDPMHTKINATDFAIPEFDRVGMQPVYLNQITNPLQSIIDGSSLILGYAPRYIEYKTAIDRSFGAFKTSMSSWVMSYGNESIANQMSITDETTDPEPSTGVMNYTMFKVNPNCVDPIFAVAADSSIDTDQLRCSTFFDIKAVRNLDTDGLPY